jgi:hypothetical protein
MTVQRRIFRCFEVPNYENVFHLSALLGVGEQNATVESLKSKVIFETIFARTICTILRTIDCLVTRPYLRKYICVFDFVGPLNFLSSSRLDGGGERKRLKYDTTLDFPVWTAHARRLAQRAATQREGLALPE